MFFDRSIVDSQVFTCLYNVNNLSIKDWVGYKYKNIFMLEGLDYVSDEKRFEDEIDLLNLRNFFFYIKITLITR